MNKMDEFKYRCKWNPKKDITVYELALCVPYLTVNVYSIEEWEKLDENITRHFNVSKCNYSDMLWENKQKLKEAFSWKHK